MTINLGPVSAVVAHMATGPWVSGTLPPRALCTDGGDRYQVGALNLYTADADKVTCPLCLEWMHA